MLDTVGRGCIAFFFLHAALNNVRSGIPSSATYIASTGIPASLATPLAVLGLLAKALVGICLLTGYYSAYASVLGIVFLSTVLVLFKNPFSDSKHTTMAALLLAVIGGLLLIIHQHEASPSETGGK